MTGAAIAKDEVLARLADRANVAQFVSFGPGPGPPLRFCRLRGREPDHRFTDAAEAVDDLLAGSLHRSVNIRTFHPHGTKGGAFDYRLTALNDVLTRLRRYGDAGLWTIVNETIDVHDGGVSGVTLGGVAEFSPDDTPRCVEKPGVASLPHDVALSLLRTVYGFEPALDYGPSQRVEFSLHPLRVGYRHDHTIVWELEEVGAVDLQARPAWPNRFSRLLGDKTYGLLVADALGARVPRTTAITRRVAPFTFGEATGTGDVWLRTCPVEQVPGRFTTRRGWVDPVWLLGDEDHEGTAIASVLAQEQVDAAFAGATLPQEDGPDLVEGVAGFGDDFMQGRVKPMPLPERVVEDVRVLAARLATVLRAVRIEWAHDDAGVWVLQLHVADRAPAGVIHPGEPDGWEAFDTAEGLDGLRRLIAKVQGTGRGIEVRGHVGITSHVGDLLRKARVPSRITRGHPRAKARG